ncbi:PTS lactose/cellobiose transporter subunit IIA [Clostridiaceae bacterium M8S5]|nr:PTS lactose/cellobiose transporter subunit IIA [Clostridiaceae bacterium M8S5]
MEQEIFEIILHGGDARALAYESLKLAKEGKIKEAKDKLIESQKELDLAHNTQTKLIQLEAGGNQYKISLLLIHAQDQLMTAICEKSLIENMVMMYEEINQIKKQQK